MTNISEKETKKYYVAVERKSESKNRRGSFIEINKK